jgi:hypothetical protein
VRADCLVARIFVGYLAIRSASRFTVGVEFWIAGGMMKVEVVISLPFGWVWVLVG